jgi:hypothetical protein
VENVCLSIEKILHKKRSKTIILDGRVTVQNTANSCPAAAHRKGCSKRLPQLGVTVQALLSLDKKLNSMV